MERKESEKRHNAAISTTSKKHIQLHKAGTMHFHH